MSKKYQLALLIAFFLLAVTACSGAPTSVGQTGGEDTAASGQDQGSGEPFAPFPGVANIELMTATTGAGVKPLFEWSLVDGATRYSLFLQFSDGQPYWSWLGSSTSVYLGGYDTPPSEDAAGPILLDGMSWAVIALDAEGNVIASSKLQSISP